MAAQSQTTIKALGLNINPNFLDLPNGSLVKANDVIIKRENVIESRRGLSDWSEGLGLSTDMANQLLEYKGRILANYSNKLSFDTGTTDINGLEVFNTFAGNYTSASDYRMRSIEANKNLYFTTSNGIKKISAASADDLSTATGYIQDAGAVKAIDFTTQLVMTQGESGGFLSVDSAVAYRDVWAYKDANTNLILGSPSTRNLVYNFANDAFVLDFNKLLTILDVFGANTGTLITDANYYSTLALASNPLGATMKSSITNLASKLDNDILLGNQSGSGAPLTMSTIAMNLAGIVTVTFSSGDPTSYISASDYVSLSNLSSTITSNTRSINNVSFANPSVITVSAAHGVPSTQTFQVTITGTSTTPSTVGTFTATSTGTSTFTIPVNVTSGTTLTGTVTYQTGADFTIFNGPQQVTSLNSTSISFLYNFPTGATPYAIPATAVNTTSAVNSYNYTNIIMSGNGNTFPNTLNETEISAPITAGQMATITDDLNRIVNRLSIEKPAVLSTTLIANYLTPYNITESGDVQLRISIPTDSQGAQLSSDYFLQIYRSNVFSAFNGSQSDTLQLGVTVIPDDELHLVYEYFPTATDFSNGYITFTDTYPDSLAQNNTPLYTNPVTGDGILQSNDIPPYSNDISYFRNYAFYANTKTRHLIANFQLIGVDNIVSGDKITIANANTSSTYTFVDGTQEKTTFTITAASAAALKTAVQNKYFTINNVNNNISYYVWYRYDGVGTDPAVAGHTGVIIDMVTNDTVALACQRTSDTLNDLIFDFTSTFTATTFVVTNVDAGITATATIGNISSGNLAFIINTVGTGEDATNGVVQIARTLSAAQNIDLTARSLIRVINRSATSPIYAYYTSGDNTSPGQIALESKVLSDTPFYVVASSPQFNTGTLGIGNSFTPDISPIHVTTGSIATSVTAGYVTFTATAHGLQNGFQIILTNTNSVPIIDGVYNVANVTTNTFDILHSPVTSGTHFSWELTSDSVSSTNSVKPNRVYYSKFNQPDAVPALNYFDIGPEDKEILRIFPLRTTLFVFKQDGLYRLSGQSAPFQVQLFDSSCILIAPDTVDVTDNTVFGWTTKGIATITESGTSEISTPVDVDILKLASYPNFKTITWGIGYNSDYSYTVFTNGTPTDETATIGYRYSTLTKTWTNIIRNQTCGIIRSTDDKLYMGSGIDNIINKERKNFDRTDYADRDFTLQISPNLVNTTGTVIQYASVSAIDVGDVIYQDQYITIYKYNALLQKLDLDPGTGSKDYYSTLVAGVGSDMRSKLLALAAKLDADSGVSFTNYAAHIADITLTINSNSIANPTILTASGVTNLVDNRVINISGTPNGSIPSLIGQYQVGTTGTWGTSHTFSIPLNVTTNGTTGLTAVTDSSNFLDIQACYNAIINQLNNDPGVTFTDYNQVTIDTPIEAVVVAVDRVHQKVTLNLGLQWVVGPSQIYKAIPCEVVYAPLTFGDVLKLKQVFEATSMFSNTAFTSAKMSFSSDLKPDFISVAFNNLGNGIFGSYSNPGFGFGYFGGGGNAKPFRTLIPLQTQRCRFINIKFEHQIAREIIELYGVTLTANIMESTRAYR